MWRREIHLFFTALMFYTRIPCPRWLSHEQESLNLATKYFPVIGWVVGSFAAGILMLALIFFPPLIAVILSTIGGILMTGAFHEDGFMDTCDAFGGGWTKEKILEIMKDSRMGAFGVLGMICLMCLKIFSLEFLCQKSAWVTFGILISVHTLSRYTALLLRLSLSYVSENEDSKAKPIAKQTTFWGYLVSSVFSAIPLIIFHDCLTLWLLVPMVGLLFYAAYYFKKWIGGYTGDSLGAVQQVAEVLFYLTIIATWK
jgi:adenosylcobinamide-GDP ribazoletransferase